MGSVYSVTRRQQHLEGKCSSQLRDLQAGVKKKSGWTNIEQMTKDLQNDRYSGLLNKVAGIDLFAVEANFQQLFYSKFYSKYQTWRGYNRSSNADENVDLEMLAAQDIAFDSVKSFIQKEIITNQHFMSLSILHYHDIHQLEQENFPNPHFCSKKLIKQIEKDESISQLISFQCVMERLHLILVGL